MATYHKNRDLINIGAYPAGSSPVIDEAIRLHEPLNKFLRQRVDEGVAIDQSWQQLEQTMKSAGKPTS
jgi:flagellum-specific ATP synthase